MASLILIKDSAPRRLLYKCWYNLDILGLMMKKSIHALFDDFKNVPFPQLGKMVGDFPFYDSLIAGIVSSFLKGERIDPATIPVPDPETEQVLEALIRKQSPNAQEIEFASYVRLLNELREEVIKNVKGD